MAFRHIMGGVCAAAAVALFASTGAHAQTFNFTSTATPNVLTAGPGNTTVTMQNGSGTNLSAPAALVLSNLILSQGTSSSTFNQAVSIAVSLTDVQTSTTLVRNVNFNISGTISGTSGLLTSNIASQAPLTFAFGSVGSIRTYTVGSFTFTSPQPEGSGGTPNNGAIGATLTSADASVAPEPGSFALLAPALVGAVGIARRRKKA